MGEGLEQLRFLIIKPEQLFNEQLQGDQLAQELQIPSEI